MSASFQAQIQHLAQIGVVTHVIADPGGVDSLFAISKVRDLPEVSFAAAFGDGPVVLGCQGALPEALQDLAVRIELEEFQAETMTDAAEITAKLDQILADIAVFTAAPQQADTVTPQLEQIVQGLNALSTQQPATVQLEALLTDQLSQCETTVRAGQERILEILAASQLPDGVRALLQTIQTDQAAAQTHMEALPHLSAKIEALIARPEPTVDLATVTTGLAQMQEQLSVVAQTSAERQPDWAALADSQVEQITQAFREELAKLPQDPTVTMAVEGLLRGQNQVLTHLSALPDVSAKFSAVEHQLATLLDRPAAEMAPPDLSPLQSILEQTSSDMAAMHAQIAALPGTPEKFALLEQQLATLIERPAPDDAPTELALLQSMLAQMTSDLGAMRAQIQAVPQPTDPAPQIVALHKDLGDRFDLVKVLDSQVAAIAEKLDLMARHPDAASDLMGQGQAIEDLQTKLNIVEAACRTMQAANGEIAPALAKLQQTVDQLPTDAVPSVTPEDLQRTSEAIDAQFAAQISAQQAMAQRLPEVAAIASQIERLSQQVDQVASCPEPVVDMSQLEAPFARFQTTLDGIMADVAAKMDHIVNNVGTVERLSDIQNSLDWLVIEVAAAAKSSDIDGVTAALDSQFATHAGTVNGIAAQVGQLDEQLALQTKTNGRLEAISALTDQFKTLASDVGILAARGDPVLDLTEQRQDFARFQTALGAVVVRLEAVADDRAQADDISRALTQIEKRLDGLQMVVNDGDLAGELKQATDRVSEQIAAQDATIGMLSEQMKGVLDRPAPTLDITAQRETLARFGTALAQVVHRFDGIATRFDASGDDVTEPDFMATLADMSRHVESLQAAQDASFDELSTRLNGVIVSQAGPNFAADEWISVDQLCLRFIEVIAAQIKQNTVHETLEEKIK